MKFKHLFYNEVALTIFSENFEINVVYDSKACAAQCIKFFFFG